MNGPRRVVMLTASLGNGGLERQLVLLAGSLPSRWRPYVWSLQDGPYASVCRDAGIPVCIAARRLRFDVSPAIGLWRSLTILRPHVVHTWNWTGTAAALPWCRSCKTPLIDGTIRRGDKPPGRLRPDGLCLPLADLVVANSRAGLRAMGVAEPPARVVYNGFDEERLTGVRPRRRVGCFTAVMAARMDRHKDHETVIAAARRLLADTIDDGRPPWHFVFVGGGTQSGRLRSLTEDLVRSGHVEFVDGGLEPLDEVAGADVGVLMTDPSFLAEGCSNALLEYMACGLPAVCSDSGGNREVVVDGDTGFVVPARDDHALAMRLAELRADPKRAARMGARGRERVRRRFSRSRMVHDWSRIYDEFGRPSA